MSTLWDRRADTTPRETKKAFGAFVYYLEIGSKRTLRATSEGGGYSVTGVRKWSSIHDWDSRASAYDVAELQKSIDGREQVRERARQVMMNDAEKAAATIGEVMRGKLSRPECGPDCAEGACVCGVWAPVFDRHGDHVSDKQTVTPATRQAAAQAILDRVGLTPPKRVALTGKDGEQLRLDARLQMGKLTDEKLATILDVFAPDPDSDDAAD